MTQFDQRNISMMMDLYEMTMANGYFSSASKEDRVTFDVFYRTILTAADSLFLPA